MLKAFGEMALVGVALMGLMIFAFYSYCGMPF